MSSEIIQFRNFPEGEKFGNINYSRDAKTALQLAEESRLRLNRSVLGTEHMLIGIMQSSAGRRVFDKVFNCDVYYIGAVEKKIQETMKREDEKFDETDAVSGEGKQAIQLAVDEAKNDGSRQITGKHLLKGLMKTTNNTAAQILQKMGIDTGLIIKEPSGLPVPVIE